MQILFDDEFEEYLFARWADYLLQLNLLDEICLILSFYTNRRFCSSINYRKLVKRKAKGITRNGYQK